MWGEKGGRPGAVNSPYGLCGRKAALKRNEDIGD